MKNNAQGELEVSSILSTKREVYVDIVKGFAMFAIIIFHCSQGVITGNFSYLLGAGWAVPLFFIIGGFFLREEKLCNHVTFMKGKFKRLYLPATIIYCLCVLLHNLFVNIGWYPLGELHPASGIPYNYYGLKDTGVGLAKVLAAGGSGELAMGAMWFIYSLLYTFVGMTIIYWMIGLFCKTIDNKFYLMTIFLLLFSVASCVLSQNYGFTVNRISTSVTAMFLVWWGMIINRKLNWQYNKWWGLCIALIIFVHCVIMQRSEMTLARNEYQDLVYLSIGSTAAVYLLCFIGKMIKDSFVGKFFALLGRESLYLMAFHIIGFFICNSFLVKLGVFNIGDEKGLYTYKFGNNPLILLAYVSFAIGTSFAILYLWRFTKLIAIKALKR